MVLAIPLVVPARLPAPGASRPTLNDVVRSVLDELPRQPWLDWWHLKVLRRLASCGTGEAGYLKLRCDECGHTEWVPLGCRDRHCPSCDVKRSLEWQDARASEALDGSYFHYVFTVPGALYPLFLENQEALYSLFFAAVKEALYAFSANPKLLGGTPAFFGILHTTNRQLGYHPHLHCLIAGVALDEATGELKRCYKPDFLFPARQLASSFRGRFLAGLHELYQRGELSLAGPRTRELQDPAAWATLVSKLYQVNWNLRTEHVDGSPLRVIRYLARYTHRTAISNARIVGLHNGQVTYIWKHRKSGRRRQRTLPVLEFVKRFSRHILPKGFKRVRFYGLLSPSKKHSLLPVAQMLAAKDTALGPIAFAVRCALHAEKLPTPQCPCCGSTAFLPLEIIKDGIHRFIRSLPRGIPPPVPQSPYRQGAA